MIIRLIASWLSAAGNCLSSRELHPSRAYSIALRYCYLSRKPPAITEAFARRFFAKLS